MKAGYKRIYFLAFVLIISIGDVNSLLNFNYPSAINLSNGNIFIVEKEGIYVYDGRLKNKIHSYTFRDENDKINDSDDLSKVSIKTNDIYVLCLINSKIFIFDNEGNYLFETEKLISDQNFLHPTLTLIPSEETDYCFYIIGYLININGSYNIKLIYNKINGRTKENTNIYNFIIEKDDYSSFLSSDYPIQGMGLSSEYLKEKNYGKDAYLVNFYIIKKGDTFSLTLDYVKITNNELEINTDYESESVNKINEVKQIKSVVNSNGNNALICCLFTDGTISCHKFRFIDGWIDTVEFYDGSSFNFNCQNVLYGMKLNYIGQKISLSCISDTSTVKARFYDKELNLVNSDINEQFTQCSSIYGHSIVQYNYVYYVISDVICDNYKRVYELLDGELSSIVIITTVTTTQKLELLEEEENEELIKEEKELEEKEKENLEELEQTIKEIIEESLEIEIKESVTKEETYQIIEEKFDCSLLEKCKNCDQESFNKNLCISCNNKKNYYYLNNNPLEPRNKYIDCINEETKPSDFYFNKKNLDYEPCFYTCATCEYGGNSEQNNCSSCDGINYIKNPIEENSLNCVTKCKYHYYIKNGIYKCTDIPFCPEEYYYIIKDKFKCIDNCINDKEYIFKYGDECFKECPNNTKVDNNICKDNNTNKCQLTQSEVIFINENITFNEIEKLVIRYINEFNYTNNHVSLYKNLDYEIVIYINNKCILELELGIPKIDLGSCYEKVVNNYSLINRELIIAIINKKLNSGNTGNVFKIGMFSPLTGKYLKAEEICKNDKITIIDSMEDRLLESRVNLEFLKEIENEGVDIMDIFNLSSSFYKDICFQYNSKKDIALKDRVLEYFPNITLCEEGCDLLGINLTEVTAICECYYSDEKKKDALKNKILEESQLSVVDEIISSSNIYVVKCINLISHIIYIKKCYGSFIILALMIIEIIFVLIYFVKNSHLINEYIYMITNRYISHYLNQKSKEVQFKPNINNDTKIISLKSKNKNQEPPKHKEKKSENCLTNIDQLKGKSKTKK